MKLIKSGSLSVRRAAPTSSSESRTVSVAGHPIVESFPCTPTPPLVSQSIKRTADVTGGTTPYTFRWNFGDGTAQGTTNPVSHSYATKGSKTVTLNVTDANNQFKESTQPDSVSGTA